MKLVLHVSIHPNIAFIPQNCSAWYKVNESHTLCCCDTKYIEWQIRNDSIPAFCSKNMCLAVARDLQHIDCGLCLLIEDWTGYCSLCAFMCFGWLIDCFPCRCMSHVTGVYDPMTCTEQGGNCTKPGSDFSSWSRSLLVWRAVAQMQLLEFSGGSQSAFQAFDGYEIISAASINFGWLRANFLQQPGFCTDPTLAFLAVSDILNGLGWKLRARFCCKNGFSCVKTHIRSHVQGP